MSNKPPLLNIVITKIKKQPLALLTVCSIVQPVDGMHAVLIHFLQ